jgi:hypothetical protein
MAYSQIDKRRTSMDDNNNSTMHSGMAALDRAQEEVQRRKQQMGQGSDNVQYLDEDPEAMASTIDPDDKEGGNTRDDSAM